MAVTIDYVTGVISIPRADMPIIQPAPNEIRELDVDVFRLELRDLEDNEAGSVYPITHNHAAPVTVGGVTLARVVEIINSYTVTFEDGQYAVSITGANSNIADVANVNQVSVRSANSAGLIQVGGGDPEGIADAVLARNIAGGSNGGRTVTQALRANRNRFDRNEQTNVITVYQEDDTTVSHTYTYTSSDVDPITSVDPD